MPVRSALRAPPAERGASQGGFGPPLPPFALLALRARNALAAQDVPKRSGDTASWCTELLASHSGSTHHRGKRQTLPMRRGRRKKTRPRVVHCTRDLGVAAPAVVSTLAGAKQLAQRWAMSQSFRGYSWQGADNTGNAPAPEIPRSQLCSTHSLHLLWVRIAGRADHEQLSSLLPVRPRISRQRLNACTGSMRADANDDHLSDAVGPSRWRQPRHPQSAAPRAAAWPRRRLFPFSQPKCA